MSSAAAVPGKRATYAGRFDFVRPYAAQLAGGLVLVAFTALIQLAFPAVIGRLIDRFAVHGAAAGLGETAGILCGVLVIQAFAMRSRTYLFSSSGSRIVADLRKSLLSALLRQEIGFFDFQEVGELTNRLAADVEELRDVLTQNLAALLQALVMGCGSAAMLVYLAPRLSPIMLLVGAPAALAARWIGARVRLASILRQIQLANCGHIAQEVLCNVRLVHAYTREREEEKRYAQATASALEGSLTCNRLFASLFGLETLIRNLALLITLWLGARLVVARALTVGDLTSFVLYAGMAGSAMTIVSESWGQWMQSLGATERVFELLNRAPRASLAGGLPVPQLKGAVEFESVSFAYPTRPSPLALNRFSLRITAGEKVALVGPSGAGKTTVVSLLLGFYSPACGTIRFDGVDAMQLRLEDLRKHMAIVEQEPVLFSGTILDNIRCGFPGPHVGEKEAIEAAVEAHVDDFVCGFPRRYDTLVGNRGLQLSGGQKQRIAIARALLRNPGILILDEATSALDSEGESKVQSALSRVMKGRTTVMIAHRLSTVAHADRVVVMNAGEVAQSGSHGELILDRDGLYFRLMQPQLSIFDRIYPTVPLSPQSGAPQSARGAPIHLHRR